MDDMTRFSFNLVIDHYDYTTIKYRLIKGFRRGIYKECEFEELYKDTIYKHIRFMWLKRNHILNKVNIAATNKDDYMQAVIDNDLYN